MSVNLSEIKAKTYLAGLDHLHISCINSPRNVTISGTEAAIDSLKVKLDLESIVAQKLRTGIAYHSPLMQSIEAEYADCLQNLQKGKSFSRNRPTVFSTVTGEVLPDLSLLSTPEYWVKNMTEPVQYAAALSSMVTRSETPRKLGSPKKVVISDLVEIGPHCALQRPTRDILEYTAAQTKVRYNFTLSRQQPAIESLLKLCGRLWSFGYPIALEQVSQLDVGRILQSSALIDLPKYPFNHAKRYWYESSVSRETRLRQHPRLELLGVPVPEWNPLEPRWRKFLDASETPWIKDHKVNGKTVYPASGMVVMTVEAAKQLAAPEKNITWFRITDTIFSRPIVVESRVEVQLALRSTSSSLSKRDSDTYAYRICARMGDEWQENCHGTIQVQYQQPPNELDSTERDKERTTFYRRRFEQGVAACKHPVSTESMYHQLQLNGLTFGPSFRAISHLAWDGENGSRGTLRTFEWTTEQSQHPRQSHVVHPTTVDAMGQLIWVALTKGATTAFTNGAAVTRIKSAWVRGSDLAYPDRKSLRAHSTSRRRSLRVTESSLIAIDENDNVKIILDGLELTTVSGTEAPITEPTPKSICFDMIRKPDVTLMSSNQIVTYCRDHHPDSGGPISFYKELRLVMHVLAEDALLSLEKNDSKCLKPEMQELATWLEAKVRRVNGYVFRTDERERTASLVASVQSGNAEGNLLVTAGRKLESIITGTYSPLDMISTSDLLHAYYEDFFRRKPGFRQLQCFLGLLAHKDSGMRILEIGGERGSITTHLLEPFKGSDCTAHTAFKFRKYKYINRSETLLQKARESFESLDPNIEFELLNLEDSSARQGIIERQYDIVIAAWSLSMEPDHATSLQNVRKLLKPGGKLVLIENIRSDILGSDFAFSTLSDSWMSTKIPRERSPCLSEIQWHHLLITHGFSDDFAFPDYRDPECQEGSIIIATAIGELPLAEHAYKVRVIVDPESSIQAGVARRISELHENTDTIDIKLPVVSEMAESTWSKEDVVVFLPELERRFLYTMGEIELKAMQSILRHTRSMVWVGVNDIVSVDGPLSNLVIGLARAVCTEVVDLSFATALLENHKDVNLWAHQISGILDKSRFNLGKLHELEFVEEKGMLMIDRVQETDSMNHHLHVKSHTVSTSRDLCECPPLALSISNPGFLDSFLFVEDSMQSMDLQSDELEIEVKAVGVNFRDLLVAQGKLAADGIGCECAGVVTWVGIDCTTIRPGDCICAVITGCFHTYARCKARLAVQFPSTLSFAQAASFPLAGVTAHHSLSSVANLQYGESILIHSGAGGTGQMVIQIAQTIGAIVFVTVSTKEKQLLLKNTYNIPADHIFYSRDTSFAQDVMRMTENRGVDVVLNSLSGDGLIESWHCIAPFGRFVEIGNADIENNFKLPMTCFAKNVSFSAVAVDQIYFERPEPVRKSLVAVVKGIEDHTLRTPLPLHEFGLSDLEAAFRFLQSGKSSGRVILNFSPDDRIPVSLDYQTYNSFGDSDQ